MCARISSPRRSHRSIRSTTCRRSQSRSVHRVAPCSRRKSATYGTWSLLLAVESSGTANSSSCSLLCLAPVKPTVCAKVRASRRFVITTLISPLSYAHCLDTTPNSSSSCCTSAASRRLRVEYDTWIVLRGSSEDEPSPVNSACKKTRFTAGELVQMKSGTRLSALRKPAISARTLDRSGARSWMSSSCRRLPDAINREDTYRRPPTTLS